MHDGDRQPPPVDGGFGLYIHWPFCRSKCPYCDFNSHVRQEVDEARWRRALLRELDHWADRIGRRQLRSIFMGGGTPSLMPPAIAAALIERAHLHFDTGPGLEITLEANPTSVEAGRFAGFRDAGVNRVSLGVQALRDADLAALGREHDAREALAAVELAARTFDRWSFDLIYARPGQTGGEWEAELRQALRWAGGHLSAYQLTIEPGTHFATLYRQGRLAMPDEDTQATLYELTQAVLAEAGMPAYEISNHAAPGHECRHNLVYWRYGEYLGIGPGAHGRLTLGGRRRAVANERLPERWLSRLEAGGASALAEEELTAEEQVTEALMMGLRLAEGVPLARLERLGGAPVGRLLDCAACQHLGAAGQLEIDSGVLRLTMAGRQRLDAILPRILAPAALHAI